MEFITKKYTTEINEAVMEMEIDMEAESDYQSLFFN